MQPTDPAIIDEQGQQSAPGWKTRGQAKAVSGDEKQVRQAHVCKW